MRKVTCLYGEDTVGDGWSNWYDTDTDKLIKTCEYSDEADGYESGLKAAGIEVEAIALELFEDADWEAGNEWWGEVAGKSLSEILLSANENENIIVS